LNENVSGYQLIDDVANALLNDDKVDYQNLETLLRKALEKGVSTYTQGVAYRLLGEIAEAKGNVAQAIDMYTTALQYAPKLPIRKKLKALKESIGG
jgi:tetratricopeptide (TPR) repeat protein